MIKKEENDKDIITKDDYNDKVNLKEFQDNFKYDKGNEDDSLNLPKLHFFDYILNNLFCQKRSCCDYRKQKLIWMSNKIIFKYFSVENILSNQIKLENLLKDYKWNDPGLNKIQNNELIIQLKSYLPFT